jgi:hypothetical protein
MVADEWLDIVQAGITKSGLPYRVVSCRCRRDSPMCFATIEHERTRALREVTLSRDIFLPEEMPNGIVEQLRAFNVDLAAPCAKGHLSVLQFEREELRQHLTDGTLTFYCTTCDEFREPTAKELGAIRRLLTEPVA